MTKIVLKATIKAPRERCFLLSLNVDLHQISTKETNERAIAGVTSGVMKLNDVVTWRAKHFGIYQNQTTKISSYDYPSYFVSELVKGIFKRMHHQHLFQYNGDETTMTDIFVFEAPLGILGRLFSRLVLKKYMTGFLLRRNETIKQFAEGEEWRKLLKEKGINSI